MEENAGTPWAAHLAGEWLDTEIQPGLDAVEDMLWRTVKNDQPLVRGPLARLLTARGRRLRPLLALLSAQYGDPNRPDVTVGATACELLYVAGRCHEEVLDGDALRRGVDSDRARWNNNIIILAGDSMVAIAAELVAQLDETLADVFTEATARQVSGRLRHIVGWSPDMTAEQHHVRAAIEMSAHLRAACVVGGRAAGAPTEVVDRLRRFAEKYGVASHLAEELRDLLDDPGTDPEAGERLRDGVPTLPVLLVRERTRAEDTRLLELLGSDLRADRARFAETRELLLAHEVVGCCQALLDGYVQECLRILAELPEQPATEALRAMATSIRAVTGRRPEPCPAEQAELLPR